MEVNELKREIIKETSNKDTSAYLYTASLVASPRKKLARIYLHLGYKITPKEDEGKNREAKSPRRSMKYEKYLLQRLKYYIYRVIRKEFKRIRSLLKAEQVNVSVVTLNLIPQFLYILYT